jgi:hypothetical protein
MFHVSKLRPYYSNDDSRFPGRESVESYDFGEPEEETGVDEIDSHKWKGRKLVFHVKWSDGDDTWEPLSQVNECIALETYLALQGVKEPTDLKRQPVRKSHKTRTGTKRN